MIKRIISKYPMFRAALQMPLSGVLNVKICVCKKTKTLETLANCMFSRVLCGPDGTRTRDLRRDRAAF